MEMHTGQHKGNWAKELQKFLSALNMMKSLSVCSVQDKTEKTQGGVGLAWKDIQSYSEAGPREWGTKAKHSFLGSPLHSYNEHLSPSGHGIT